MMPAQGCKKGHISQEERVEIYVFLREGLTFREIGRRLNRSHTSISREIKRNRLDKGWGIYVYKPLDAEKKRIERRLKANKNHIILWRDHKQRELLENYLKQHYESWGPDELLGRIKVELSQSVISTSTFYRFIREEKPILQRYLRYKQKGYKTKKKGNKRKKMYQDVPNIKERPEIIEERGRLGDFEGDTVVSGKKYKGGIVSLADRMSRHYFIKRVGNLKANTINITIQALLKGEKVETITFDNGTEFSNIKDLEWQCYRADPYASYQRGTNEKHNGFFRRFIPKGVDINSYSDEEIQKIQDKINHKPRKILGYRTPHEIYYNTICKYLT